MRGCIIMNILIVYGSKHGSAKQCAETLTKGLQGKVDLCNIKEDSAPSLAKYDKVIIGGSIYAGTMHKEVREFCTKNLNELKNKKLGFFICCMNKKAAENQLNSAFPQDLLNIAVAKKNFGGQFKFKEMNFFEKLITKMVSKSLAKDDPSLVVDTKKDISLLSQQNINDFIKMMNKAS